MVWIFREHIKCSGCRLCEITCSIENEGCIWPEASRIRIIEYTPGVNIIHLCSQCENPPCIKACPEKALEINLDTEAIIVNQEKCTGCGACIKACPSKAPTIHPTKNKAIICNLCNGDPKCVKICNEMGYNALTLMTKVDSAQKTLYAKHPEEIAKTLIEGLK